MDQRSTQKLNEIASKDANSLTQNDIIFLRARQSYLNRRNRRKFAGVLRAKPPVKEVVSQKTEKTYRELQAKAKELGLKYVGVSRDDLERVIDTAVGPEWQPKP